ncbi:unnamed protein product, partial [Aphanomyces euteiches]
DGSFNVQRAFIKEDSDNVRTNGMYTYIIVYEINIASLVFVIFSPRQKADLREMDQKNRT